MSPVEFPQGDAVEGDLRVVPGGLQLTCRLLERRVAALDTWLRHPRATLPVSDHWTLIKLGYPAYARHVSGVETTSSPNPEVLIFQGARPAAA